MTVDIFTLEIFKKYSWNCWSLLWLVYKSLEQLIMFTLKNFLPNPWIPTEEESWIVFSEFWGDLKIKTKPFNKILFYLNWKGWKQANS